MVIDREVPLRDRAVPDIVLAPTSTNEIAAGLFEYSFHRVKAGRSFSAQHASLVLM